MAIGGQVLWADTTTDQLTAHTFQQARTVSCKVAINDSHILTVAISLLAPVSPQYARLPTSCQPY